MKPTTDVLKSFLFEIAPDLEGSEIREDADLINELDIDSMDFLDFVIKIAKSYGIEIPESDYSQLSTLNACIAYIEARQSA